MRLDVDILAPAVIALAGATALAVALLPGGSLLPQLRLPGTDAAAPRPPELPLEESGTLTISEGTPADLPGSWPRFRGARLDGIGSEGVPLARSWGPAGPSQLWALDVGEGYAGAAVDRGRVYLLDYDREARADAVRCLSLADGREIWRYSYPVKIKRNHGMSRTVPTLARGKVVTFGPKCHVTCVDAESGELQWAIDLVWEHGAEVPPWYAGQNPLVDGDRVILAPSGPEALLMAVDLQSGEILWKTPNPRAWTMTHSSIVPVTVGDRSAYLYCGSGGVAAVAPEDGSLLWPPCPAPSRWARVASSSPGGMTRAASCSSSSATATV